MKIQQPRWAWGGESHKELDSLLHSIPRQELGMKALGESEFGLLEWIIRALSTGECKSQEERTVGGGRVYIELSQDLAIEPRFKIRTKSQGSWNVRLGLSVKIGAHSGRAYRTLSDGRFLFVDEFEKNLKLLDSVIFTSSNTPLLIVRCSYTHEI
jgi:hypothetical protein